MTFDLAYDDCTKLFTLPHKVPLRKIHWYSPDNTNSGFPDFGRRCDLRDKIIDDAYQLFNHIADTPTKKFIDYKTPPVRPFLKPMVAPKDKIVSRATWCYPAVISCLESVFVTDVYKKLIKQRDIDDLPVMIGRGMFTKVGALLRKVKKDESVFIGDYVKGDKQVPAWKLRKAFGILENWIDFKAVGFSDVTSTTSEKFQRVWSYLKWYFINTPFVFCDILYRKDGGFPSGSNCTLLLWLIINVLDRCAITRKLEKRALLKGEVYAGGDDGVSFHTTPGLTLSDFQSAAAHFGTKFHSEPKSSYTTGSSVLENPVLSTHFDEVNAFKRDEVDVFGRACYPSRWCDSYEEAVGRLLSLSMSVANTMEHFKKFCLWILKNSYLNLKKPIMMDKNIAKYHRYVTGLKALSLRTTTLGMMIDTFSDDVKWFGIFIRL